jgi:hypothetical protein
MRVLLKNEHGFAVNLAFLSKIAHENPLLTTKFLV